MNQSIDAINQSINAPIESNDETHRARLDGDLSRARVTRRRDAPSGRTCR
jgi:hypothetical protein